MKIAYFFTDEHEKEYIEKQMPGVVTFMPGIINDYEMLDQQIQAVCIFVDSFIDEALLRRLPNLKCIITRSIGFNHIDLAAAKKYGITVCYAPTYATCAVAEFTIALMLMLTRRLAEAYDRCRQGNFSPTGLMGIDIYGKTLGIIGAGNIGSQVAVLAHGLGMRVIAYDVHKNQERAQQCGFTFTSIEQVLAESDVVSLHVAYSSSTHHLIGDEHLPLFKKGAFFINTARGEVVKTEMLVRALNKNILAGVALDVLEEEWWLMHQQQAMRDENLPVDVLRRLVAINMLLRHPRAIITPHLAFSSAESSQRCLMVVMDAIRALLANKIPEHVL